MLAGYHEKICGLLWNQYRVLEEKKERSPENLEPYPGKESAGGLFRESPIEVGAGKVTTACSFFNVAIASTPHR